MSEGDWEVGIERREEGREESGDPCQIAVLACCFVSCGGEGKERSE